MAKKSPQERLLCDFRAKLDTDLKNCSNVFIIGHNEPDFDAIGSAIGLYALSMHYDKQAYIIVNDEETKIEAGTKKIIDDNRDLIKFITRGEFLARINEKSLLIITDTNKTNMIAIRDDLDKLNKIFIIDHHETNDYTIDKGTKYIDPTASSASEIVSRILNTSRIRYSGKVANYLYAGISLDTKKLTHNTTSTTFDVVKKLINHGANGDDVRKLFLEGYEDFCRVADLVKDHTIRITYNKNSLSPITVAYTLNREKPRTIYKKEDYAKAAEQLTNFIEIDGAIAMGPVEDNIIHISMRSVDGKKLDSGKILGRCYGGGTPQSAGGRVETEDIFEVEKKLREIVEDYINRQTQEEDSDPPKTLQNKI